MTNEDNDNDDQKQQDNLKTKHPLLHTWTLWYDTGAPPPGGKWGDNLKQVYTVSTIEDFWRLYNNISRASTIQIGASYNFFKKGIEPQWEDPSNGGGGKWTVIVPKNKTTVDNWWLDLVLACIGDQLDDEKDYICGAVINFRKNQDKLSIWTKNAEDKEGNERIGRAFKKLLLLKDSVGFQQHQAENSRANKYTTFPISLSLFVEINRKTFW